MKLKTIFVAAVVCLPAAALAQTDQPAASGTRVRWGVTGNLGAFLVTPTAIDFGVNGRIGAQLSDLLGVYAQLGYIAGVGLGGSASSSGGSLSVSGVGYWYVAAMAEADIGGSFFVAGGPMIANGGWGQVGEGADASGNVYQYAVAAGGWMPGLDLRTGFTFGSKQSNGRHGGFTLALDFQVLYASVSSAGQGCSGGSCSQKIKTGDHILGMTPTLVLGYDAK